jgi:hypothetical protein
LTVNRSLIQEFLDLKKKPVKMLICIADLSEDEMEEILNETKNNLLACRDKPVKLKTGKEIKIESIKYDKV